MGYSAGRVTHFKKNLSGLNAQLSARWSFQSENTEHRHNSIKETSKPTKAKTGKLQKKNLSKDSQGLVMDMMPGEVCCPTYFESGIYANNSFFIMLIKFCYMVNIILLITFKIPPLLLESF